jgi:hypothetical protein
MQANETATGGGAERAEVALARAINDGIRDECDRPSEAAVARARALTLAVARAGVDPCDLEVSVGADGVIEYTSVRDGTWIVVHVESPSARIALSLVDAESRTVISTQRDASESDVVRALERAA